MGLTQMMQVLLRKRPLLTAGLMAVMVHGDMNQYPTAEMWRGLSCPQIYGGTNQRIKSLIGRML